MIVSENRYFDLIQDSVGRDSKWTRAFRTAWGLDPSVIPISITRHGGVDVVPSHRSDVR